MEILRYHQGIGELSTQELFSLLLLTPLSRFSVDGSHETVCIVIDGLDECGSYLDNDPAKVLSMCLTRFPSWIRFLLTSREVDSVRNLKRVFQMVRMVL